MTFLELFLIGIGLSMDALAVSICKGLATGKAKPSHMLITGAWFGGFQALMPLIGFLAGSRFEDLITSFDHWIAFGLLVIIGANMLREALSGKEEDADASFAFKNMLMLAIATSIDALAVGVSFAFLSVGIIPAVLLIGCTTFVISATGIKIGSVFGSRFQKPAEITGGVILILIGVKILLEHLGIL